MQRSRLLNTAVASALASLIFAATALAGIENKPAKISWTPSRVVNENVDAGTGTFVVDVSADKEVLGAQLWVSGSLAGVLEWDPTPFDILEGATVQVTFTLLQTPDEAGRTLGGTVHLRADGKNLARPLSLSLKKTAAGEDPGEVEVEGEDGIVDPEGDLPISWAVGEGEEQTALLQITPDLFDEAGLAQIMLIANRPLENVQLWLTPSLRDCVIAYLPAELIPSDNPGVLTVDEQGRIVSVAQDQQVPVTLELLNPLAELGACGGTLHVRSFVKSKRTWPAVLGVALGETEGEEEQEEVAPSAIVDAANFKLGPVAPGQIVSIFGSGIAPLELSVAALDEDGLIPEDLSGVMVLADGYPMRLMAAGRGQINAVVPANVKGKYADIVVINKGKASAPITVGLKKVVPRVFTAFGTGTGQAAAVNPKGVLNGGASPASVGGYLSLWVTGVADTSAPDFDPAAVATEAVPLPFPIRVYIGGQEQILLYAGTAPGMLQAVTQINVQIAPDTPSGPQPVLIVVGAEQSPTATTVTVK
jgi:uncharacterized protein (TIGR03437 family)